MGKKLPRKTMSMAKRGTAVAEEAAGLDLLEDAIGNPETDGPNGGPRFDMPTLICGWLLAMASVALVLFAVKAVFPSADTNYAMLPEGYAESVGLVTSQSGDGLTSQERMTYVDPAASVRSPFPEARTQQPVILDVTCPAGNVEISTGPHPVDTVCVRGQLVEEIPPASAVVPTPMAQRIVIVGSDDGAMIGGTTVPDDLNCFEDEVIGFVGIPDTLVCVHIDTLQELFPDPDTLPSELPAAGGTE